MTQSSPEATPGQEGWSGHGGEAVCEDGGGALVGREVEPPTPRRGAATRGEGNQKRPIIPMTL